MTPGAASSERGDRAAAREAGWRRASPVRLPVSTYRLQLHGLGFAGAAEVVPYLARLGVDTLYSSPFLAARRASTHGYDVVDPTRLDEALGSPAEFEALLNALERHEMGLLIDFVPNHLAADYDNRWWRETLAGGPEAPAARIFDIDWAAGANKVVLPILGAPLRETLLRGEITLGIDCGLPILCYHEHRFPLDPASYSQQLLRAARESGSPLEPGLASELLAAQHYRLSYWRDASKEVNYRRFFDIDHLVGVAVEDAAVFEATHSFLLELVADPRVRGVRVDHIDGLADPARYLERLDAAVTKARGAPVPILVEKILAFGEDLPASWPVAGTTGYEFADILTRLLVLGTGAEAIEVAGSERTAESGSLALLGVQGRAEVQPLLFSGQLARLGQRTAAALRLGTPDQTRAVTEAVALVATHLGAYRTYCDDGPTRAQDRERLTAAGERALASLRPTSNSQREALSAVIALFCDVPDEDGGDPTQAGQLAQLRLDAVRRFQQHTGAVAAKGVEDTALYRYSGLGALAEVGIGIGAPVLDAEGFHAAMLERAEGSPGGLSATSTHDTKRSEDVRARLLVLSELGPSYVATLARWSQRYGPARARQCGPRSGPEGESPRSVSVLDELRCYEAVIALVDRTATSSGQDEEDLVSRVVAYVVKSAREAKRETSWLDPDRSYEEALGRFVTGLLAGADEGFRGDVDDLVGRIDPAGTVNSLTFVVTKATAPGIPDIYQGNEVVALALVDPDNRRRVDFSELARSLAGLDDRVRRSAGAVPPRLVSSARELKQFVTRSVLTYRRSQAELFATGAYVGLDVVGPQSQHFFAFARIGDAAVSITLGVRHPYTLAGPGALEIGQVVSSDTVLLLPSWLAREYRDIFTGRRYSARSDGLAVGELTSDLPVAVLSGCRAR